MSEKTVLYCPHCGHIGPIKKGWKRCCPDSKRVTVPEDVAKQARAYFFVLKMHVFIKDFFVGESEND
jgi:hypothetical protein